MEADRMLLRPGILPLPPASMVFPPFLFAQIILFYPIESRLSNLFSKICPHAQRLTSMPRLTIMFIRIGCYSAILCFRQFRIRRERIHAFRKVHEPPGFDESKNDDFCVGNAFMHSAPVTSLSGYVEWKNVGQHRREWACSFRRRSRPRKLIFISYLVEYS